MVTYDFDRNQKQFRKLAGHGCELPPLKFMHTNEQLSFVI